MNLKEILEGGNIPFTDLLPNEELIEPLAYSMGYTDEILNSEYEGQEPVLNEDGEEELDEEGNVLLEKIVGRMEDNPLSHNQYVNKQLTDNMWIRVKPLVKDIMLADKMKELKEEQDKIDKELDLSEDSIRS